MAKDSIKDWDFFNINRPAYPPTPEVLVSSLIWNLTSDRHPPKIIDGNNHDGIIYEKLLKKRQGKPRNIIQTSFLKSDIRHKNVTKLLLSQFSLYHKNEEKIGRILNESLKGSYAANAKSVPIIPLNIETALMQDSVGIAGKDSPSDFAQIIERMFLLGGGEGHAAAKIINTYARIGKQSGWTWFDDVTHEMIPAEFQDLVSKLKCLTEDTHEQDTYPEWLRGINTPFHWFANSLTSLTEKNWSQEMPRRRWIDWLICVLRTAIGTGFIFECQFYYQMVLGVSQPDAPVDDVIRRALAENDNFLSWDSEASISSRDVSSKISKGAERGVACRSFLEQIIKSDANCPKPNSYREQKKGLENWLTDMRKWIKNSDENVNDLLQRSLSGGKARSSDMYETIQYSLLNRGGDTASDQYSMLQKRGSRYTILKPASEWFVVISSLQASNPGGFCRVAEIVDALEALGISAGYKTIIAELESVGLARSSHDADDAIVVAAAF